MSYSQPLEKVEGVRGVFQARDDSGKRVFVPQLKLYGELQDLGSFPTANEASLAYDICKLHAALYHKQYSEDVKLNNSAAMYMNNPAFVNLRENTDPKECAELLRSGALLDQFSMRFRPQLRGGLQRVASQSAVQGLSSQQHHHHQQDRQQQPKRERDGQEGKPSPPTRTQSMPAHLAAGREQHNGGGGGSAAPATATAACEQAAAPSAREEPERTAAPVAPSGKGGTGASSGPAAAGGGGAAAAGAEEDAAKKRKARWIMYEGMHTVWISERTAAGNSLSIPAFVKDKVFAGVEDGDKITMVNHRSKKEYTWRYRNLRKEGDASDKHYLSELKKFVTETHVACGDVLQVQPLGDHKAEFIIHRANTDFVHKFLAYMDTKPPSEPRGGGGGGAGAGAGTSDGARGASPDTAAAAGGRQRGEGHGEGGGGKSKKAAAAAAGAAGKEGKEGAAKTQQQQQRQKDKEKEGGSKREPGERPRKKAGRAWAQFPARSGQWAMAVTENVLRSGQVSLDAAVWSALIGSKQADVKDWGVKALHTGSGTSYPLSPQPNAEGGGGGVLRGLLPVLRSNNMAAGDVLAFRPGEPSSEGRVGVTFQVWRAAGESAGKFRQHLEQLRREKGPAASKPAGAAGEAGSAKGKAGKAGGEPAGHALQRSGSSGGPQQAQQAQQQAQQAKPAAKRAAAEQPEEHQAASKAAKLPHAPAAKRQQVLEDSSSDEEDGEGRGERSLAQAAPAAAHTPPETQRGAERSPKRKAAGEADAAPAAKRPAPQQQRSKSQGTGAGRSAPSLHKQHSRERGPAAEAGAAGAAAAPAHGGQPKHAPADSQGQRGGQQQQQQPAREPDTAAGPPAAELHQDLSHLPPKKRMLLMAQKSITAQKSFTAAAAAPAAAPPAAVSVGQTGGGGGASGPRVSGGEEGAGDSQGDSVRRRAAGGAHSGSKQQQQQQQQRPGHASSLGMQQPSSQGRASLGRGGGGEDENMAEVPIFEEEQDDLLTPTSPAAPPAFSPHDQPRQHAQQPKQQQQQQQARTAASGRQGTSGGRQTSPAEHSSGTAGDRPQLQHMGSITARSVGAPGPGATAAASLGAMHAREGSPACLEERRSGGGEDGPCAAPHGGGGGGARQAQQAQQECSAVPPSGSAAMGSAGLGGTELRDAHLLFSDEVAVVQEVMRLVDLTAAAGKLTPELAADLKMGMMSLTPLNRWCAYSTLKPLYDVASWDKLVECMKKAAGQL